MAESIEVQRRVRLFAILMSDLLPSVNSVIPEFSFNDFTERKLIGSGGEGVVFHGYNDRLGKVAVKRLNNSQVNKTNVMKEVSLLAKLSNHPNIIHLVGILTPEEGYSYKRSLYVGYIMEYMENGSLYNVIHNNSVEYDMKQVYSWIEMASSGLQYLHEVGIMHRDIKPKNILLGKSLDDLRISDFGFAKVVGPQTIPSHSCEIGTLDYMAPELHNGTKYGKSVDIYALSITFWEIIYREKPYGYMGKVEQPDQIRLILEGVRPRLAWLRPARPRPARPAIQERLEILALLERGWHNNPKSRPQISEFIEFSRQAQENLRNVVSQQNVNYN